MRQQIITAELLARVQWGMRFNGLCKDGSIHRENIYSRNCDLYYGFKDPRFIHERTVYYFDQVKPLLFSSLTEPITVAGYNDGKPFVPMDHIIPIYSNEIEKHRLNNGIRPTPIKRSSVTEMIVIELAKSNSCPIWLADLLNQWHCNYRLLPGEFVPATNEYALL